jgi:spore maturation protein CgeB
LRILAVHPGASWATADVHTGLVAGLRATGHDVIEYALDGRLRAARVWLEWLWRRQVRGDGPLKDVRPTDADVQYQASQEAVTRALRHDVDWVLVVCAAYFHPDCAELLRRAGVPAAALFTESPYDDAEPARMAPRYAVCFTNERTSVPRLREANRHTHYLPAAYDPASHGPGMNGEAPSHDVVFVGTGFDSRLALLSAVDWTGIDLGLYGAWGDTPRNHPLAPYLHQGLVGNARAGALYRRAKIGLNLYRATGGPPAESLNPRAYELAADGVFTLSHPRAELEEKFGDRVFTFQSASDLGSLVRHLLRVPRDLEHIGRSLPALVAEDTYPHRAQRLVAHLQEAQ